MISASQIRYGSRVRCHGRSWRPCVRCQSTMRRANRAWGIEGSARGTAWPDRPLPACGRERACAHRHAGPASSVGLAGISQAASHSSPRQGGAGFGRYAGPVAAASGTCASVRTTASQLPLSASRGEGRGERPGGYRTPSRCFAFPAASDCRILGDQLLERAPRRGVVAQLGLRGRDVEQRVGHLRAVGVLLHAAAAAPRSPPR